MGIKFINPKTLTKIVSISDEAIDREKSDMVKYLETYEIEHLKFTEGEVPTYFVIGNLGSTEIIQIQQEHYITEMPKIIAGQTINPANFKPKIIPVKTGEMLLKYFKFGVRKIIDGKNEMEVTEEIMDTIPSTILQEVGALIMGRSYLTESKKK